MSWSSEGLKVFPKKALESMTEKDWFEFRNTLDYDTMGFFGTEGYPVEEYNIPAIDCINGYSSTNSLNIQNNLTTINYTNGNASRIKYIVIHYTANNGDTAWGNTNYFKSTYRGASAHYFVDENSVIWRCVEDKNIAWHCGGALQSSNGGTYYNKCKNNNSIGIEMCSRIDANGKYYFKGATITNCIMLVKFLMNKYNIPITNVIRHYDVTGKTCPEPFVRDSLQWDQFRKKIVDDTATHWAQDYLNKLVDANYITDVSQWNDFDSPVKKSLTLALLDNVTGGRWPSNQANPTIHWAQPIVISLTGKNIINEPNQWIYSLDSFISKALLLALIDKMTNGTLTPYNSRFDVDHWGRNCLDSLCDKGIVNTPSEWTDFESNVTKGALITLVCKALNR